MAKGKSSKDKATKGKAAKGKAAKPGRPPKLDKESRKAASEQLWGDPSFVVRHLARLVVFLAAAWPTLQSFSAGSLEPLDAAVRLVAAGVFALVSVAFVSWIVGGYRRKSDHQRGDTT